MGIFGQWAALSWRWPLEGLPSEIPLIRSLLCIGLPAQKPFLRFRCRFRHKAGIFWTSASEETGARGGPVPSCWIILSSVNEKLSKSYFEQSSKLSHPQLAALELDSPAIIYNFTYNSPD